MDKLIVTNFKMNLSKEEVLEYKKIVENSDIKNLIISPSNIYLDLMSSNKYDLCAQNGYYEDFGTHTGEVSFKQLKSLGVKYSLIGHSETRNMSNEDIPLKLKACINNGIVPILCVGNDINEKDTSKLFCILDKELKILSGLKINDIIIAYEPTWAIGTGVTPSLENIKSVHTYIKNVLSKVYNIKCKVIYGGSVNMSNIKEICSIEEVDGVLIGSSSLNPNNLLKMYNKIK